jgi:hypothetical protein
MDTEVSRLRKIDFRHQWMKSLFCRADRGFARKVDVALAFYRIHSSLYRKLRSAHSESLGGHSTRGDSQETQQIRYENIPIDHRRRSKDHSFFQEAGDLRSGRSVRRCFLYSERKGKTHRRVEDREGSHLRHFERSATSSEKVALPGSLSVCVPQPG